MSAHLREAWANLIDALYEPGQHVLISHPEIGEAVGGTVNGHIMQTNYYMVEIDNTDGLVSMVHEDMMKLGSLEKIGFTFSEGGGAVDRTQYSGYIRAYDGSTQAGYLDYAIMFGDEKDSSGNTVGDSLVISMIEVEPGYRRQGLATLMLDELIKRQYTNWGRKPPEVLPGLLTDQGARWWPTVEKRYASLTQDLSDAVSIGNEWLESVGNVPTSGMCGHASQVVADHVLGVEVVNGTYRGANHCWNEMPDGTIVDVTASQFGHAGVVVIPPDDVRQQQYQSGKTASTWRGFSETPFWKEYDAVIATQMRGRQRYYEVWVKGESFHNYPRLAEAKTGVEAIYGPLDWTQVTMPLVEVYHYYFGFTDEFTDPVTIYIADIG